MSLICEDIHICLLVRNGTDYLSSKIRNSNILAGFLEIQLAEKIVVVDLLFAFSFINELFKVNIYPLDA